ncbi:MAG: hypothetical protein INQ03_25560 [Candidatus Heimdallarchaeota archaeon]|nr:hypothetical protein [Candidatus Heimdallarchaeota archaeon]
MSLQNTWITDLSSDLKTSDKILIFFMAITLVGIPIAILYYLFKKKVLRPTLVSDGIKLALYEESGSKINVVVTKYYYNPKIVNTIHACKLGHRNPYMLGLFLLSFFASLGLMVDLGSVIVLVLPAVLGLIFWFFKKKTIAIIYNAETIEGYSDDGYYQSALAGMTETRFKSMGNVSLGNNAALVFGGVDGGAERAFNELYHNFDLYVE